MRFKDLGYKDLNRFTYAAETDVAAGFGCSVCASYYMCVVGGCCRREPRWCERHRERAVRLLTDRITRRRAKFTSRESYDVHKQYPRACAVNFAYDFTGDGWADQWCATGNNGMGPGVLYVNPKNEPRRWERSRGHSADVWIEVTALKDVDGDGKPELIMGIPGGTIVLARPDPAESRRSRGC